MKKNGFVKDMAVVTGGNIIYMIANIMVGFLLPLIISVEDYGYYKIYTLYLSYSGLLHFGFIDGVYLEYSGRNYSELNKKQFRTYSLFLILMEILLAGIITILSLLFLNGQYMIIGICIAMGLIAINIGQYYQYISQAISRFSEFSKRKVYNSLGIILSLVLLFGYNVFAYQSQSTYWMYVGLTLVINFALTIWFVSTYKDITFGDRNSFRQEFTNIVSLLKKGAILTIAYEASRIVLLIDRQFVSILFPLETYAKYAFAYNILSCVTSVIIGVSTVLFPKLKRMTKEESVFFFPKYMMLMAILVCFFLSGYYPVVWIVTYLLPNYIEAIVYFKIVFPVLALSSCITIIIFTYYKLYNKNQIFLLVCIITLGVSILTNGIAYYIFRSAEAISVASIFTTIIWYLFSIVYIVRKYHVRWIKNFLYTLIMIATFYITVFTIKNSILSMLVYFIAFIGITYLFYKKTILKYIGKLLNSRAS